MFSLAGFDKLNYLEVLLKGAKKQREECDTKQWKFEFRGKVIVLRELADKVIDWLEKFQAIGDAMVQFDPVHAALPWGGVRFLLQVCSTCDSSAFYIDSCRLLSMTNKQWELFSLALRKSQVCWVDALLMKSCISDLCRTRLILLSCRTH